MMMGMQLRETLVLMQQHHPYHRTTQPCPDNREQSSPKAMTQTLRTNSQMNQQKHALEWGDFPEHALCSRAWGPGLLEAHPSMASANHLHRVNLRKAVPGKVGAIFLTALPRGRFLFLFFFLSCFSHGTVA